MLEAAHGHHDGALVTGLDEVGRGPLAGPVVACAVILPTKGLPDGINDSKKLSPIARLRLDSELRMLCHFGLGQASVEEIDEINILNATFLAMERALAALSFKLGRLPDHVLVDGNRLPKNLPCPGTAVVGGDAQSLSIAAASIIAKVERDLMMQELALQHPGYGWETNAGYGCPQHMNAIRELGVTPHHRRSFAPVAQRLAQMADAS